MCWQWVPQCATTFLRTNSENLKLDLENISAGEFYKVCAQTLNSSSSYLPLERVEHSSSGAVPAFSFVF